MNEARNPYIDFDRSSFGNLDVEDPFHKTEEVKQCIAVCLAGIAAKERIGEITRILIDDQISFTVWPGANNSIPTEIYCPGKTQPQLQYRESAFLLESVSIVIKTLEEGIVSAHIEGRPDNESEILARFRYDPDAKIDFLAKDALQRQLRTSLSAAGHILTYCIV